MQKIIIKNFRQISFAEVELKKIVLLTGKQASGKSTVAKLIYFFKSLKEDFFDLIYQEGTGSKNQLEKQFIQKIQHKFKLYFGFITELNDDFEAIFYYNFEGTESKNNRYLKLSKKGSLNIEFDYPFFGAVITKTQGLVNKINTFNNHQKNTKQRASLSEKERTKFINSLNIEVNKLFNDTYNSMFFPAGRNITVSYPEQFKTLFLDQLNTNSKTFDAKAVDMLLMKEFIFHSQFLYDNFNDIDFESSDLALDSFLNSNIQNILQGKYDNVDGNEQIKHSGEKNMATPLRFASSGQQESIRIIQDIVYSLSKNEQVFRIFEEPEAHLYPESQRKLIELMCLLVNTTNSQIIITTHSPYVLSILNNLLMYSKVIERKPDKAKEMQAYFKTSDLSVSKNQRINLLKGELEAYILDSNADNYCLSIIDKETGLVGDNYLDNVTEELNNDFDVLYRLNFQK